MRNAALFIVALAGGLASTASGQFVDSGVWNRFVDWGQESQASNVWHYGVVSAGTNNSWYESDQVAPLQWTPNDQPSGGAWSAGNRNMVDRLGMSVSAGGDAPVISWSNPAGDGTSVNIDGRVRIQTPQGGAQGSVDTVEFVLAKRTASGEYVELRRARVNSADLRSMGGDGMVVPISLSGVTINDGESFVMSSRAVGETTDPSTVQIIDDISIAIQPPEQTGKILDAAYHKPIGLGSPGGVGGGGGGGGGGGSIGIGEPPFPSESILDRTRGTASRSGPTSSASPDRSGRAFR